MFAARPSERRHSTTTQAPTQHPSGKCLLSDEDTPISPSPPVSSTPRKLQFDDDDITSSKYTHIVAHQSYVKALYEQAASKNGSEQLLQIFKSRLPHSVIVLRDEDIPSEPLDENRLRRVQALEHDARCLARRIQQARERYMSQLQISVPQRIQHITATPDIPSIQCQSTIPAIDKDELRESRDYITSAVKTIAKLRKVTSDTKKRAASVREVLRMIDANTKNQESTDVSVTIPADWSESYEHRKQIVNGSDENVSFSRQIPLSPIPAALSAQAISTSPRRSPNRADSSLKRHTTVGGSGGRNKSPFRTLPR